MGYTSALKRVLSDTKNVVYEFAVVASLLIIPFVFTVLLYATVVLFGMTTMMFVAMPAMILCTLSIHYWMEMCNYGVSG